jgi:hypothetical protein
MNNWSYFSDPYNTEYFSSVINTINTGLKGDCDDFAITLATLIHSIGGKVRIISVQDSITGHMFTEVYLVENPGEILTVINQHYQNFFQYLFGIKKVKEINYIKNDNEKGIWLNLDWSSKYPGGDYFIGNKCTIYYPFERYFKTECEF